MILLASVLEPIEGPLTEILKWLHGSAGLSWAWAIVVLTVMVRIVLVPLTIKQVRSMAKLQQHAPELKAIQQKYKGDKQRMNEEVMRFYKENKVNPAASCLPIVLQIPVFISLFYVLRGFEKDVLPDYKGSDLGFIQIVPDITDKISDHWSGWVLLVLYVGSQLASTFFMMTTADKTQRLLFMAMPFVFVFFIVNFPVGLMIYWVTTNLWTVGQGLVTRREYPRTPVVLPKKTSRTPPAAAPAAPTPKPAKPGKPAPAAESPAAPAQRQVRRRKKKGPRARR